MRAAWAILPILVLTTPFTATAQEERGGESAEPPTEAQDARPPALAPVSSPGADATDGREMPVEEPAPEESEVAVSEESETPVSRWFAENYIGVDLVGALGFLRVNVGSWGLYYEHVFGRHHGVQVRFDLLHVHQSAEHIEDHQWTFGGSATYRYYTGPGVGGFVGLQIGYRRGFGRVGQMGDADFTMLGNEQFRAIGQAGYRFWFPDQLLTFVPRLGLGYGEYNVWAENRDDDVGLANATFARDVLAPLGLVFELEISVGIGFN